VLLLRLRRRCECRWAELTVCPRNL